MSQYTHSLAAAVPAAHRPALEALGLSLGHSGQEYAVPLSPTGSEPATHYGLRAQVRPETGALWTGLQSGAVPIPPVTGHDAAAVAAAVAAVVWTLELDGPGVGAAHFARLLAERGLQVVQTGAGLGL